MAGVSGGISARVLDLLITNWRADAPAYLALADRIRLLVLDGRISVGARLPAERDLATRLGISRTTVSAAYAELRRDGHLSSIRGSGSVAALPDRPPFAADGSPVGMLDFSKAALPATPELAGAAVRAAERLPAYLGLTGFDPVGLPELREAIAERYTGRGLPTSADQIMVTIGAQSAIALVARVLLERGDTALVEAPSYPHAFDALRTAGGRLVTVNVTTEHGWDEEALEHAFRRTSPTLGYVMPDFHNPTGQTMSPGLRERMLALAARHGTVMVADETMAELDIDSGELPLPLPAYGAAIAIGSFGKTVWGGVRIGWIRAEADLVRTLVRARPATDLGTPLLEQLIAIDILSRFDDVLEGRRRRLLAGRDHLERALAVALPEWTVPHVTGGLTTWVGLGHPLSSQLTLAARGEGLLLAAGPRFGVDGAFERFLRLPFCYSADETDAAVAALARAWTSLSRHPLAEQNFLAEVV